MKTVSVLLVSFLFQEATKAFVMKHGSAIPVSRGLVNNGGQQIDVEHTIRNFRESEGLPYIYRCANTDKLVDSLGTTELKEAERLLLYDVKLILDLRSNSERDEKSAQRWMSQAPGGSFRVVQGHLPTDSDVKAGTTRYVLRLDPLSPDKFMSYLEQNWLSPSERAEMTWYKLVDGNKAHSLRMNVLNQKGLLGLNQAILETGKDDVFSALKAITVFREQFPRSAIAIHCVQGKDRTGLVVMLCQSILGISNEEIIDDYHRSESTFPSAAANTALKTSQERSTGKLDRSVFRGAPREVMEETTAWLGQRYGSISGYLDDIGFDFSWRKRAQRALGLSRSRL